jgi:tape measure domain-containing protein
MAGTIGTAYIQIAPNMTGVQGKIAGGLKGSGTEFANQFQTELSGKSAALVGVISGVAAAATQKAMQVIGEQFGAAINRFDTIQNFPRVMQNFGVQTTDASAAMKDLVKGVSALPTSLNDIVSLTEAFTPFSKNVKDASKLALALNDAMLAGGTPMYVQAAAMEQFRQALAKGQPQLQDWRSLETAMPAQLQQIAKALGLGSGALEKYGTNGQGLYNAMTDGKISLQDFNNTLLQLDKQGLGTLPSFQVQAKNASQGVATSFQVLKQRIQQVMVDIFTTIGQGNISEAINTVGKAVAAAGKQLVDLVKFIAKYKDIFGPIAVGLTAIGVAMLALNIADRLVAGSLKLIFALMDANPIGLTILALAGLVAGLTYFFTKTETGRKVWADFTGFLAASLAVIKKAAQDTANFFGAAWDKITAAVGKVKDAMVAAKNAVVDFVNAGIKVLDGAAQATLKWLYDWRAWFINIGIVLSTLLIPTLIRLGVEAVKAAAQWVGSMATAAAATAKAAAESVVNFVKMSISASIEAVKSGYAWTVAAGEASLAWLKTVPGMIQQFIAASGAAIVNATKASIAWVSAATTTALGWAKTFALYALGVAQAAIQTLAAGARMAAGWLLAMGPIGLIIAVVTAAVGLIIANWNTIGPFFSGLWNGIKNVVSGVIGWITTNWPLLLAIITGPIGLAVLFITRNFQSIRDGAANAIGAVASFFGGLPGRILGAVGNLGGILYNAGRSMIQGLLNGAGSLLSSIGNFFLSKLPGWIVGPFKSALGIHSPSTVFAGMDQTSHRAWLMVLWPARVMCWEPWAVLQMLHYPRLQPA